MKKLPLFSSHHRRKVVMVMACLCLLGAFSFRSDVFARSPLSMLGKILSKKMVNSLVVQLNKIERGIVESEVKDDIKFFNAYKLKEKNDNWIFYFQRIRIRIRPHVSFQIPGAARLRVSTHAEFVFKRKNPEGWENYRPQ
jgi:hypothetical protein